MPARDRRSLSSAATLESASLVPFFLPPSTPSEDRHRCSRTRLYLPKLSETGQQLSSVSSTSTRRVYEDRLWLRPSKPVLWFETVRSDHHP